jgi:protein-disulfide isomerase
MEEVNKNFNSEVVSTRKYNPYLIPIAIVVAGIIIAGAILYAQNPRLTGFEKKENTAQAPLPSEGNVPSENKKVKLTVTERDHIRGNPSAPVTIVEYSDFQCPFCERFHSTLQQILADYPDKIRWVYRHFPLDQLHPEARPAAEASECVAEQKGNDGFWQFADSLFENQSKLGKNLYKELAKSMGLNMAQFEDCLSSRKYKDRVEADLKEGINFGVNGTPGNFVNDELVLGAVPYQTLKTLVEKALDNR